MIDTRRKIFVLDTNVLLHNPGALHAFGNNHVVIPMTVLEELDKFKTSNNELGRNSREVARTLDGLRGQGSLREGVPLASGGMIQVVMRFDELGELLAGVADNRILGCAHILKREGLHVNFVSKDINARLKADALGIPAKDFDKQKVDIDSLYNGWREVPVPPELLAAARSGDGLDLATNPLPGQEDNAFSPNEFILLRSGADAGHDSGAEASASGGGASLLCRHDSLRRRLRPLRDTPAPYEVRPRNIEQHMALDLLLDRDLKLVTLVGTAGTGKTLLALAAGLARVLKDHAYSKLLATRPIMPLGKDIGYLPGSKDDKLTHWMGPIFDNLHFILERQERDPDDVINRLLKDETVNLEALTYIRGRSISSHFVLVDEAQNLTPHEVKTIISRAGENTKIVLTGDPYQIDNPYLDSDSNGLTYLVERMREQPIAGHITLTQSERSALAGLAADLL